MKPHIDKLNSNHILLDASWKDSPEAGMDTHYCFQSLDAVLQSGLLYGGTSSEPVTLYIAPGVYWLHDPERDDSPLSCNDRGLPCEKQVRFDWLKIVGLSENPSEVVLAARKGQSFGCVGNYTMFSFEGKGLWVQNLTFGNYCNVDLEYPWNPALSRPRRTDTVTQAQLADFHGEELWAENCRFVSRLNLMPISGAAQSVYRNCHFESTDDALNGHAVYEECDFDFYGGCPFWATAKSGVIFQKCIFRIHTQGWKFAKHGGQIACLECRFESTGAPPKLFSGIVNRELLIYELRNTWDGKPFSLRQMGLQSVPLDNLDRLTQAFLHWKKEEPVCLKMNRTPSVLAYEDEPLELHATVTAFSGRELPDEPVHFEVVLERTNENITDRDMADRSMTGRDMTDRNMTGRNMADRNMADRNMTNRHMTDKNIYEKDLFSFSPTYGQGCILQNCNKEAEAVQIRIRACTDAGLRDEIALTLLPRHRQAPHFNVLPSVQREGACLKADYRLDIPSEQDDSLIVWYRLPDVQADKDLSKETISKFEAEGAIEADSVVNLEQNAFIVARGRGTDCARYLPDIDDAEHWLFAEVTPECRYGEAGTPCRTHALKITSADITCPGVKETDFRFLPLEHREGKGLFLFDEFIPSAGEMPPEWRKRDIEPSAYSWSYGSLGGGCVGSGVYPMQQGSSVLYEPSVTTGQDMQAEIVLDPAKTAGQGFGSAGQYLDILLRFDSHSHSGMGVRVIRTTQASDGVEFALIRYVNGVSAYLTEPVIVSCFLTGCRIFIEAKGNFLRAEMSCSVPQNEIQQSKKWLHEARLSAALVQDCVPRNFDTADTANAFRLIHTGTCGDNGWHNTILLHRLKITYSTHIPT